jgi:hypothetical protein
LMCNGCRCGCAAAGAGGRFLHGRDGGLDLIGYPVLVPAASLATFVAWAVCCLDGLLGS